MKYRMWLLVLIVNIVCHPSIADEEDANLNEGYSLIRSWGSLYTIQQFEGFLKTYEYIKRIVNDLSNYDVFIEDGRNKILITYTNKDIYAKKRSERLSNDVVTYEIDKMSGEILRFYYGIR
jgi:hypothetical protein